MPFDANFRPLSDVVQASPFYTVVSAAGSQFCCKDCRCGLVYEAARRCHNGQKNRNATVSLLGLCLSQHKHKRQKLVLAGPVGPVLLQGGKSSAHAACKAHSREYTSPQARLGPWARKLSTPTQSSAVSEVVEVVRLWSESTCHLGLDQIVLERAQRAVIPRAASAATVDHTVRRLRRVRGCYRSEKLVVRHASSVVRFIRQVTISISKVVRVHRVGGVTNSDVALLAIPE